MAIADPAYWSRDPRELAEVLAVAAGATDAATGLPGGAAGAGSSRQERLTMTVEEAAVALGISRAFAYEAVTRNEIPHVRIGRRTLVGRTALERMLDASSSEGDIGQ
jgi:excisionase family DNA binding protein